MGQPLLEQLQSLLKYELTPLQEWQTKSGEMGVYQSHGFCELVIASSGLMVIRTYRSPESALEDARIIAAFAHAQERES